MPRIAKKKETNVETSVSALWRGAMEALGERLAAKAVVTVAIVASAAFASTCAREPTGRPIRESDIERRLEGGPAEVDRFLGRGTAVEEFDAVCTVASCVLPDETCRTGFESANCDVKYVVLAESALLAHVVPGDLVRITGAVVEALEVREDGIHVRLNVDALTIVGRRPVPSDGTER